MTYEFVAQTLRDSAGSEGMRFFPFVFTLFMFILVGNLWGMFPYFFTFTAHIVITAALALAGDPDGALSSASGSTSCTSSSCSCRAACPRSILPFIVVIEVLSFLSRPLSLSIRLFANMLAGHITLKVFAGFVIALGSTRRPRLVRRRAAAAATIALTALEFLVAALQAYVFAILTSIYLNDALHPSH